MFGMAWVLFGVPCLGAGGNQDRAAAQFDAGVTHFDRGEFEPAARAFLAADDAVPNVDVLMNALASARKAGVHLITVTVAERILARAGATEEQTAEAGRAKAEAARHLASLRATCKPTPCEMTLDGEALPVLERLVLPGLRTLRAVRPSGESKVEALRLDAGTAYDVSIDIGEAAPSPVPAERVSKPLSEAEPASGDGLSPSWFFGGVAATGALALATTWSGVDTLRAKGALSERPSHEDVDDVEGRIRRTDLLLGATVLAGVVTAVVGWQGTDWEGVAGAGVAWTGEAGFVTMRGAFW
jgi:hypothetical protein